MVGVLHIGFLLTCLPLIYGQETFHFRGSTDRTDVHLKNQIKTELLTVAGPLYAGFLPLFKRKIIQNPQKYRFHSSVKFECVGFTDLLFKGLARSSNSASELSEE